MIPIGKYVDGLSYEEIVAYGNAGNVRVTVNPLDFTDNRGSSLGAHAALNFRPLWEHLKNGEKVTIYDINGNFADFKLHLAFTHQNNIEKEQILAYRRDVEYNKKGENIGISFCRKSPLQETWHGVIDNK